MAPWAFSPHLERGTIVSSSQLVNKDESKIRYGLPRWCRVKIRLPMQETEEMRVHSLGWEANLD